MMELNNVNNAKSHHRDIINRCQPVLVTSFSQIAMQHEAFARVILQVTLT